MIISNKDYMEKIVKNNTNMKWDNWTVVVLSDDNGYYNKDGIFKNNKWITQHRFEMIDYNVWNIPDRFILNV